VLIEKLRKAEQRIPNYDEMLEEFVKEEMPIRLKAHDLTSVDALRKFMEKKAFKGENVKTAYQRILKEEFLVPALYRDLLLNGDFVEQTYETLSQNIYSQTQDISSVQITDRAF